MLEVLGTIPLASWGLAVNLRQGFIPWVSWADTHSNYSRIVQVPAFVWRGDPEVRSAFDLVRWSFVACAFVFFAFFGFADEARKHYRLVYTSLASRIGISTSNGKLSGSTHWYVSRSFQFHRCAYSFCSTSSFPHMSGKGGVSISVVTKSGDNKRDSTISISDQLSIPSISIASDFKPDLKLDSYSPSESTTSSSAPSFQAELYNPSSELSTTSLTLPPASVPALFSETTIRPTSTYSTDAAHAV